MIPKTEVITRARERNLVATTIEKDYVLSWVLAGIRHHPILSTTLVFKGGTCLKKCYFGQDYRYSEDLDFTLLETSLADVKKLHAMFKDVCQWISEEAGIEIPLHLVEIEQYLNPRGNHSFRGKLRYRGPLRHKTNIPKIKIDITVDECIVTKSLCRKIIHEYSDQLSQPDEVLAYTFDEIFAEKIRALFQRTRPRDVFDVICLNQQKKWPINRGNIIDVLKLKCQRADIKEFPTRAALEAHPHHQTLRSEWHNMLGHQIANLKPVEYYWEQLEEALGWLAG